MNVGKGPQQIICGGLRAYSAVVTCWPSLSVKVVGSAYSTELFFVVIIIVSIGGSRDGVMEYGKEI